MVPTSELTSPKVTFASKPDTVWVPPAPTGRATCLTLFFIAPHADIGRITTNIGRISSFFQSVGYLSLRNGETVWVVAHHQQMTESQKTILAQGRVSVARSPGELILPSSGTKRGQFLLGGFRQRSPLNTRRVVVATEPYSRTAKNNNSRKPHSYARIA